MTCLGVSPGFKHLKKLSLGHNHLRAFPKLKKLPLLSELRLNGNQITTIPHLVPWPEHEVQRFDVGMGHNQTTRGLQVLLLCSIYQGPILGTYF